MPWGRCNNRFFEGLRGIPEFLRARVVETCGVGVEGPDYAIPRKPGLGAGILGAPMNTREATGVDS